MKKNILIFALLILGITTTVSAAPQYIFQRSVLPELDSTYYLGTTTPSVKAWLGVVSDQFCLTGDACISAWVEPIWELKNGAISPTTTRPILINSATSTITNLVMVNSTSTNATTTRLTISGVTSSLLKTDALGVIRAATAGTDYESSLTAGDGLTRTLNDFDCDTASGSVFGCLTAADWTTFNNKLSSSLTKGYFLVGSDAGVAQATSSIFVSSTGKVGIGTSTPGYELHVVQSDGSLADFAVNRYGGGGIWLTGDSGHGYVSSFKSGGNLYLRTGGGGKNIISLIDSTGYAGIGTSSPSSLLSVHGNAYISSGLFVGGNIVSTSSVASVLPYASTTALSVSGTAYIGSLTGTLQAVSGEVSASSTLSVAYGGTGATTLTSNGILYGNARGAIQATAAGTGGQILMAGGSGVPQWIATSTMPFMSSALTKGNFLVGNDSGVAQATSSIFVSSTGNVGIGDTTPSSLLTVGTGDAFRVGSDGQASTTSRVTAQKGFSVSGVDAYASVNNAPIYGIGYSDLAIDGAAYNATQMSGYYGLSFVTGSISGSAVPRMVVTQSGKVGIGTTTPEERLNVYTTASDIASFDSTNASIARIMVDARTAGASSYLSFLDEGNSTWSVGRNDSNTNSLDFSNSSLIGTNQRMSLTTTGNLGIGTTSPFAKFSIHSFANATFNKYLFAVASSTASATSTLFAIDNNGHQRTGGVTPTLSSCGTGSPEIQGDDMTMRIKTGGSTSACTVTFAAPWEMTPACQAQEESTGGVVHGLFASSTKTTTVLTHGTSISNEVWTVMCRGSHNFTY